MTAFQTKITRMAMLAVCSAALTAPLAVFAQDAPPLPPAQNGGPGAGGLGGGRGGDMAARMQEREARQLDMMTTQLSLTPDQVTAIKQINADSDAKMQAAFQGGGDRSQMMALRQDREAKTRAVLTPAQQPKFDEMMQRQRERMERGGGPGGPGGNGGGGGAPPPPPPPAQQ